MKELLLKHFLGDFARDPAYKEARAKIEEIVRKPESLYSSLHAVGDDPIKSCIQDDLERLLDPDVFKLVTVVFALDTDDDFLTLLPENN